MRANKQERAEREAKWQIQNDDPGALCEGSFYIWNRAEIEMCPSRENCVRYGRYVDAVKRSASIYDMPQVRFYYVDAYRKCKFRGGQQ